MNPQIQELIYGEKTMDVLRSIAVFMVILIFISLMGIVFFAAH